MQPATPAITGSHAYFGLIKSWLGHCDQHDVCGAANESDREMPKRLLDVRGRKDGVLILRCSDTMDFRGTEYIAVSHRWGQYDRDTKAIICTHEDNYECRQEGFASDVLPESFRFAVEATRQLGKGFLWIDSLCVLQSLDGAETQDWKQESKRMELVYANAYCTLALHASHQNLENPHHQQSTLAHVDFDTSKGKLRVSTYVDDFGAEVDRSELNSRGWVMQERILSRRTVHFGPDQTYFECGSGIRCQNFARLKPNIGQKSHFLIDPNFPSRLLKAEQHHIVQFLQWLCQEYSKRALSVTTDRSRAFLGLEQRIAKTLNCVSTHGVFRKYLHRMLLWSRPQGTTLKRIPYEPASKIPSWSWIAVYGEIEFPVPVTTEMEWVKGISFDTNDIAVLCEVVTFSDIVVKQTVAGHHLENHASLKVGDLNYDWPEDIASFESHKCIVLGRRKRTRDDFYGIVVKAAPSNDEYVRVGVCCVKAAHVMRTGTRARLV